MALNGYSDDIYQLVMARSADQGPVDGVPAGDDHAVFILARTASASADVGHFDTYGAGQTRIMSEAPASVN